MRITLLVVLFLLIFLLYLKNSQVSSESTQPTTKPAVTTKPTISPSIFRNGSFLFSMDGKKMLRADSLVDDTYCYNNNPQVSINSVKISVNELANMVKIFPGGNTSWFGLRSYYMINSQKVPISQKFISTDTLTNYCQYGFFIKAEYDFGDGKKYPPDEWDALNFLTDTPFGIPIYDNLKFLTLSIIKGGNQINEILLEYGDLW